jgi:hypothetical protein
VIAKRIAAVLAAVAMIGAALWWRGRDDTAAGGGTASTATGAPTTVVCVPELAAACATLEASGVQTQLEPAGLTADRLVAADGTTPVTWITLDPWPAIVEARRSAGQRPPLLTETTPAASLDVALFGDSQGCSPSPTWSCVADLPGLGFDAPATGAGPAVLVALATGLAGADLAAVGATDPAVRDGLAGIKSRKPSPPSQDLPAVEVLTVFQGTYRTVVGLAGKTSPPPAAVPTPPIRTAVVVASTRPIPARVRGAAAATGDPSTASIGMPDGNLAYGLQLAWEAT